MRRLLIIGVLTFVALALTRPLPGWGVWVVEKSLGPEHPSTKCLAEPERRCRAGEALLLWALVNVKRALPEDRQDVQASLDNLIDFYSSAERQGEWRRSFEDLDSWSGAEPYNRPKPYRRSRY
jgi:hypothetical protein